MNERIKLAAQEQAAACHFSLTLLEETICSG